MRQSLSILATTTLLSKEDFNEKEREIEQEESARKNNNAREQ